jgi:hypothetical protein
MNQQRPDRDDVNRGTIVKGKIVIRFQNKNRSLIFPEWFSIAIIIAIIVYKSRSDFLKQNRDPVFPVLVIPSHRKRPRPQRGRTGARGAIVT